MCSAADDPTQYDIPDFGQQYSTRSAPGTNFVPPRPQPPRRYVLAGDAPVEEPHGSVALAVLGEMLEEAAHDEERPAADWFARVSAIKEARRRVADAESRL